MDYSIKIDLEQIINSSNPVIIELGCGEGDSTIPILEKNKGIKMDVLDLSQKFLDTMKERLMDYSSQLVLFKH